MEKFEKIYRDIVESRDVEKMRGLGNIFLWLVGQLETAHPSMYQEVVERMEAMNWHNYLTESEAAEIVEKFVNQDGTHGPKWTLKQVTSAVESIGGKMECEPEYNRFALYVAMNMIYSDHFATLSDYIDGTKLVESVYRLAVDRLKDPDRPRFIREYFGM